MTVDDLVEGANRRYNRGEFDEALRLQVCERERESACVCI